MAANNRKKANQAGGSGDQGGGEVEKLMRKSKIYSLTWLDNTQLSTTKAMVIISMLTFEMRYGMR